MRLPGGCVYHTFASSKAFEKADAEKPEKSKLTQLVKTMTKFVYAIVYDSTTGRFMMCKKNTHGYFFHNNNGGGNIYQSPKPLHGGGDYAFPGGKLDRDHEVVLEALRELREETGIDLSSSYRAMPIVHGEDKKYQYIGVCFDVKSKLDSIKSLIDINLKEGRCAAEAIENGKFTGSYQQLFSSYSKAPADNELSCAEIWSFKEQQQQILKLDRDNVNWFYHILVELQKTLYQNEVIASASEKLHM
jgi:8-oxo-dGTP pyrophosphatase MutT (NUDIX family)